MLFYPKFCLIQDFVTKRLKGIGKQRGGLYYLVDSSLDKVDGRLATEPIIVVEPPCAAVSLADMFNAEMNKTQSSCHINRHDGFSV